MADKEKGITPPYVPYRTLKNYLDGMKAGIPGRIDSSVLRSYSGAIRSQLLIALRFLGLIDENGTPTPRLEKLVPAEGAERQKLMRDLLKEKYAFLETAGLNLGNATQRQLHEAFGTVVQGDTIRKCAAFYLFAAKDVGMTVSPHLTVRTRAASTRRRGRPDGGSNHVSPKETSDRERQPPVAEASESMVKALLGKFPDFDPAWPDEVKAKWFDGFERLMGSTMKRD